MSEMVCAVVVTHNRKALLRECLQALMAQSRGVDKVLVVNNASTDGTHSMLEREFPQIGVLNLPKNVGGAGGFHEGMKLAYEEGYDWLWIMDDDLIPEPLALEELISALPTLQTLDEMPPILLASKAIWVDGELHPFNRPWPLTTRSSLFTDALEHGYMLIRAASFVSILLNRDAIARYGLPHKDYFIWFDDWEYTARVLLGENGYLVPKSVVIHKTKQYDPKAAYTGPRLFYLIRNRIWALKSSSFTWKEKMSMGWQISVGIVKYLQSSSKAENAKVLRGIATAALAGLVTRPRE